MARAPRPSVILFAALAIASTAFAASVRTRDGGMFEGDLKLDQPGAVQVSPAAATGGIPLSFPLSQVSSITLRPPLTGVLSGGALAGGWSVQDVGAVGVAGSADYADGSFSLRGEGSQFGGTAEAFCFVFQRLASAGELLVHIPALPEKNYDGSPIDSQAKFGLMIRQNPGASDRFCAIALTPGDGGGAAFYARPNAETATIVTPAAAAPAGGRRLTAPCWLKLVRIGDVIVGAQSADPKKGWQQVGKLTLEGLHDACIGMFVTSNKAESVATTAFDHVRLTVHGIRGEYFADPTFKDLRVSRLDPAINFNWTGGSPDQRVPAADFAVRWTGDVRAPTSDTYTFSLDAHGPARLYIDGKPLIMGHRRNATIALVEGASYRVTVEYYEKAGNGSCRLMWGTTVQPAQEPVPNEAFVYTPDVAPPEPPMQLGGRPRGPAAARGLVLADGTFLPGAVQTADDRTVRFRPHGAAEAADVPLSGVAVIAFHPLGRPAAAAILDRAVPGALLVSGDFADGECRQLTPDAKLRVSSVFVGEKTFDVPTQVAAAVYRDVKPAGDWIIHTSAEGQIRAKDFRVEGDKLIIDEPLLGPFPLPLGQVTDIIRAHP